MGGEKNMQNRACACVREREMVKQEWKIGKFVSNRDDATSFNWKREMKGKEGKEKKKRKRKDERTSSTVRYKYSIRYVFAVYNPDNEKGLHLQNEYTDADKAQKQTNLTSYARIRRRSSRGMMGKNGMRRRDIE